jgi:hypothetical protein
MGVVEAQPKKLIPETTTPLKKFIRTGEGVLVFAFNLAMLIVPIVSNALTPEQAVKWAGIVNGVAVISRTGLKAVSVFAEASGIPPVKIGNVEAQVISADEAVLGGNGGPPEAVVAVAGDPSDADEFASMPSTDDDAVDAPGAPVVTTEAPVESPVVVVTGPASGAPDYPTGPADHPGPTYTTAASDATADAPVQVLGAATGAADPMVSDEEEFSSVPPEVDYEDDGMATEPTSGDGDQADPLDTVGVGASGAPNPIVINGAGEES